MSDEDRWKYSAGDYGNTVTVFERERGGNLYVRAPHPDMSGGYVRRSLGYDIRNSEGEIDTDVEDKAKAYAEKQAAKLREGRAEIREGRTPLKRIFALYKKYRVPKKGGRTQFADRRRIELFTRFLPVKHPHEITPKMWEDFIELRSSGRIDGRGNPISRDEAEEIGPSTVASDLTWLKSVMNWAVSWRVEGNRRLLKENPLQGMTVPEVKNRKRPVASRDRYEALRKQSKVHEMAVRWGEGQKKVPSYMTEVLDLVVATGRRISAVRQLRYCDVHLEETERRPHGAIRWPSDTDKQDREQLVPINGRARAALDRVMSGRPGIGEAYLFPAPRDHSSPVPRDTLYKWLCELEEDAGLEHLEHGGWHMYRRMWATERKHLPTADVMEAGGWEDEETFRTSYQQADDETTLQVVMENSELREASDG